MHPLESGGVGVPAFLAKLWRLVEDSETNNLISWAQDGKSFVIQNQAKFAKEILPLNYKHNNMASFIRQLNMYGFHKITSIDNGGLKFDKDEMEFSHPYFQRGHPYLIEHIKRKIANPKQPEVDKTAITKTETINRVLNEVKNMRGRQESLDSRFSSMKQENEALWREVAILRQKHIKQQQIVNKLIQFLVTIVHPQRSGLGSGIGKRRYPLMINDAPQSKMKKPNGPIIRELTEELLDDIESDMDLEAANMSANIESPGSQASSKGSSGLEDNYFSHQIENHIMMNIDAGINPFTNHDNIDDTYFTDFYAEDALDLDDVDEIDTKNMAIYSGADDDDDDNKPLKKDRKKYYLEDSSASTAQELIKSLDTKQSNTSSAQQKGKSLLMKSKGKTLPEIKIDIVNENDSANVGDGNDVLAQAVDAANISPNSCTRQSIISNYDENSRNTDKELDDEFLAFEKASNVKQENEDASVLLKYNSPSTRDILDLNSTIDYSNHISSVQNDLDSLKDLLHNDYQLDTSQLLGNNQNNYPMYSMSSIDADTITKLAEAEMLADPTWMKMSNELFDENLYEMSPSSMELFTVDDKKGEGTSSGSELIAYQPSPFSNSLDLNDLLQNVGNPEQLIEQE